MIPISKSFNPIVVRYHYEAINYFMTKQNMLGKRNRLEALITEFTAGTYTFETLVKAPFSEIENNIVPAWRVFSAARKVALEKEINRFHTLYNYLSNNQYYYYVDANGASVNYNTNKMFSFLKLNICPYCNENYTYYFSNNGKRNYDLDHFFSQTEYPILAISFYNLVPSCKVCNFFKNAAPDPILSPYHNYSINDIFEWGMDVQSSDYLFDETKLTIKKARSSSLNYLNRITGNSVQTDPT